MKKKRIAVDLTPILPGGKNGGAKVVVMELLKQLRRLAPEWDFILLTSSDNHAELEILDAPNMQRLCISSIRPPWTLARIIRGVWVRLSFRLKSFLKAVAYRILRWTKAPLSNLPVRLQAPLKSSVKQVWRAIRFGYRGNFLSEKRVDLLFCPFTTSSYCESEIPTVCIIYDLQYRYYPDFFIVEEREKREKTFQDACFFANRLICISEFVRQTVLANTTDISADHVHTVHISLSERLQTVQTQTMNTVLAKMGLQEGNYFIYPANFWRHKNHKMLLVAYSMYRSRYPESKMKLVCTGAPCENLKKLQAAAKQMGLEEWLVCPGYLSDEALAALMQGAFAVIFPSLYEGFGMPVAEAMAMQKPVLCSNVTSLPEIAGDAALLFDPRKPTEIADAMARIVNEPILSTELIQRGKERAVVFGQSEKMAEGYLQIFQEVLQHEA